MGKQRHLLGKLKKFKGFTALVIAVAALSQTAEARPRHFDHGLGIVLGQPTGLTSKHWLNNQNAIQTGLAYSFGEFVLLYGDYLWHFHNLIKGPEQFLRDISFYVGGGAVFRIRSESTTNNPAVFGIRFPLGVEWIPQKPSLGVFFEIAPGIGLIPSTEGLIYVGIGARIFFF